MNMSLTQRLSEFIASSAVPSEALARAGQAVLDTIGVTLAGSAEPAARLVQTVAEEEGGRPRCSILGTALKTSASWAALANGTAAHALDYDDMCFVSLAHPSAPLVAASLAVGESIGASGASLLKAYVLGFETEAILGQAMNPAHYRRGWHPTSTLGSLGAAAAAARLLALDDKATARALAIAASEASGLKENFGTMIKPLHAGLAARNGVLAAFLARAGFDGSDRALEGPQGFLVALDSERLELEPALEHLGKRWEILETGITVKLFPSCAATHPTLDVVLDLRRRHAFKADDVERIEVSVDSMTPTVLIHDRPATSLEGKFSMPFCTAAAVVDGEVGLATFEPERIADARIQALLPRVRMRVASELDRTGPPLTQARVSVELRDGREFVGFADGAPGYPHRPATQDQLAGKFRNCAARAVAPSVAEEALSQLRDLNRLPDIRSLTTLLSR